MKEGFPSLLTSKTARKILDGIDHVSLDLGISKLDVELFNEKVIFPCGNELTFLELEKIEKRRDSVFLLNQEGVFLIAISNKHYFKLVPTVGAPTIEIDGVRMHRTVGITPENDAKLKIEKLNIFGGNVLDTCTGLGYTSIGALDFGAEILVTIERSIEVLNIALMNPYSRRLFSNRVNKIFGDSFYIIDFFPNNYFDFVVHDPPRFSHAGELYGGQFYRKLFKVVKEGGKIFHYVGEPGSRYRNVDMQRGIINRLRNSGFSRIEYFEDLKGLIFEK
jgi:predicted methyltransferase